MALIEALVATFVVSLISFVGIITLSINEKVINKITKALVAFAAGGLLGGAFFHLIPESLELLENPFVWVIAGFILFFIIEKFLKWRHCHEGRCSVHTFSYMSLIGDIIHNFIDGLIIVSAFIVNFSVGITTTIAVILHEIPQEIGDFAILIYGGFTKSKAIIYNFLVALTAVAGAIVGFFMSQFIENFSSVLIPIAAGGFIYIAASDLIPELHQESGLNKTVIYSLLFLFGLVLMFFSTMLE